MEETVLQNKANDNKKEHKETINVKTFQYIYVVNVIILLIVYMISTTTHIAQMMRKIMMFHFLSVDSVMKVLEH